MIMLVDGAIILDKESAIQTRNIELIELSCEHCLLETVDEYILRGFSKFCPICQKEFKVIGKPFFANNGK